jgi:Mg2+/Co2+ transporter CorB
MATDVSAPLPDLTLEESSLLVIDTGDNAATITGVVIHVSQDVPDLPTKIQLLPPLYVSKRA